MKLDTFMLWKFKELEGKLKGFYPHEVFSTRIEIGDESYFIWYDIKTNTANISDDMGKYIRENIKFKDLVAELKEMGLYEERTESRHSSTYIPFQGNLEEI